MTEGEFVCLNLVIPDKYWVGFEKRRYPNTASQNGIVMKQKRALAVMSPAE